MTGVSKGIDKCRLALGKIGIPDSDILSLDSDGSSWSSEYAIEDVFCVAKLRIRIERAGHLICDGDFLWCNYIPIKVSCFVCVTPGSENRG